MKKDENKVIACCPNCDNPVISTIQFPRAEWFCWACKWTGGIFDAKSKDLTASNQKKLDADQKTFDKASEGYVGVGCRFTKCEKCKNNNEDHRVHWTDEEQTNHSKAKALIFKKS